MKKIITIWALITVSLWAVDLSKLVNLDNQRVPVPDGGKLRTTIKTIGGKFGDELKIYDVYRKDDKTSLILFQHKKEKGNVMLKINSILYIKLPTSSRSIRVNPIQRLSGDASFGDILELNFNNYYKFIKQYEKDGFIVADLEAINKSSTYSKVSVFTKNGKMHHSDLYTYSGKLIKQVFYIVNGDGLIDQFKFVTPGKKSETFVTLSQYKPIKLPNTLFLKSNIKTAYKRASRLK